MELNETLELPRAERSATLGSHQGEKQILPGQNHFTSEPYPTSLTKRKRDGRTGNSWLTLARTLCLLLARQAVSELVESGKARTSLLASR